MTSSPPFVSVGFLIANPSGRLFHSLFIAIVSSVVPASRFLFSASVRGWWPTCAVAAFSRSCTEQWLKIWAAFSDCRSEIKMDHPRLLLLNTPCILAVSDLCHCMGEYKYTNSSTIPCTFIPSNPNIPQAMAWGSQHMRDKNGLRGHSINFVSLF
jgi:hypothetical protein